MNLASFIDHTYLKPFASTLVIENLANEAKEWNFSTICIHSSWLAYASDILRGSNVQLCTVVGFPLGLTPTRTKVLESEIALHAGAKEIDMVIQLDFLRNADWNKVENDIQQVVQVCSGAQVKVILETCYLSDREIVEACKVCVNAGAGFVKTSTGFGSAGALVHHVQLMRDTVGPSIGVKASGGIRDLNTALAMINAGASRLGTSASVGIVQEWIKGRS